jgi:hypothetical protein
MVNRILIEWDFEKPRPWFDKSRFCPPGGSRKDQARQALAAKRPPLAVDIALARVSLVSHWPMKGLGLWP